MDKAKRVEAAYEKLEHLGFEIDAEKSGMIYSGPDSSYYISHSTVLADPEEAINEAIIALQEIKGIQEET